MSATGADGPATGPTAPNPAANAAAPAVSAAPAAAAAPAALVTAAAPGTPTDSDGDSGLDRAYFLAIEDYFVKLRGAPLLLSPADWHVARRWRLQGVPLELVRRSLDEVFTRRRERGALGRISRLGYCAPAVEAAWAAHAELAAPGGRVEAEAFDAEARLSALAAALPSGLAAAGLPARLRALAAAGLDAPAVEERLAELDRETLERSLAALPAAARGGLDATVDRAIAALGGRLPPAELDRARERLTRQVLRDQLGLPVLSLFSPEALGPEPPP